MPKIYIGAGHGGTDPGSSGNGYMEKNLTLSIAKACRGELLRFGADVRLSRENDSAMTLDERIRDCNAFAPDLAVDIHINAGGGKGCEIWYYSKGGKSLDLAKDIESYLIEAGQNSRGCKVRLDKSRRDYYGFIRETAAPAVIVECAFIDNAEDVTFVSTPEGQERCGIAIARGILQTLKIQWTAPEAPDTAAKPDESPDTGAQDALPDDLNEKNDSMQKQIDALSEENARLAGEIQAIEAEKAELAEKYSETEQKYRESLQLIEKLHKEQSGAGTNQAFSGLYSVFRNIFKK